MISDAGYYMVVAFLGRQEAQMANTSFHLMTLFATLCSREKPQKNTKNFVSETGGVLAKIGRVAFDLARGALL